MKNLIKWSKKNKKWVLVGIILIALYWSAEHPVLTAFEECNKNAKEKFYNDKTNWCKQYGIGPGCLADEPDKSLLDSLKVNRIKCANTNPY